MMATISAHSVLYMQVSWMFMVNLSLYTFLLHIRISLKEGKSASDCITNVGNLLLLLKGLHMCIYIDSIEKKIYPMTSVALE